VFPVVRFGRRPNDLEPERMTAPPSVSRTDFPPGFVFGTATASYQIEGAVREDGRGPSIWDTFSHMPARIRDASNGDVACDHYHRWREDLDLMRDLGLGAYRFSVAWPRVVPAGRGAVNAKGLDFYDRLVDGVLERGLAPHLTLYHWDLPQALQDRGGWMERETALAFADYAHAVAERLGDRVATWATHNEPFCAALMGHLFGKHAPGITDRDAALVASHHLLLSHGLAVQALRAALPRARVGLVNNPAPIHPASDRAPDVAAARRVDALRNRWFHDPAFGKGYPSEVLEGHPSPRFQAAVRPGDLAVIAQPIDFLGVNYYNRHVVEQGPGGLDDVRFVRTEREHTDLGWEVYPDGLREILVRVHRDWRPAALMVTENGAFYEDVPGPDGRVEDEPRRRYLEAHLAACRDALHEGVPLQGYFAWTLVDNFEWAEGYLARFGIVRMATPGGPRVVKASGDWYGAFIRGDLDGRAR
jgi:beta-glucosidase